MTTQRPDEYINKAIKSRKALGVLPGSPKGFYAIPPETSVTIYNDGVGTPSATVLVSTSPIDDCVVDVINNNFASGQARWVPWSSGTVNGLTSEYSYSPLSAVVLVVYSGTWTMEVVR